jgi:hypothetical protein
MAMKMNMKALGRIATHMVVWPEVSPAARCPQATISAYQTSKSERRQETKEFTIKMSHASLVRR